MFQRTSDPRAIELVETIRLHRNAVKGVAASRRQIFSVCATGSAALHDIEGFRCLARRDDAHSKIANGCVSIGEGKFASVSRDLIVRIWDSELQCQCYQTPHRRSVKCIAVSNDGSQLATGAYDGTVSFFDLRTREFTAIERPSADGISSLAPAGPRGFVASCYDGDVYELESPNCVDNG